MSKSSFHITSGAIRGRSFADFKRWLIFLTILLIPLLWIWYYTFFQVYSWTGSFSDYMISILAAVIGVIGVSITGYIFMSESVRSLGDSDPYKKSVADSVRSSIYSGLRLILIASIFEIVLCVVSMVDPKDLTDLEALIASILFTYILFFSICLDLIMMNFNEGLTTSASGRLKYLRLLFNTKPLIIRVDSEEYNGMVTKKKTGNMEDFTEDYDISFNLNDVSTIPLEPRNNIIGNNLVTNNSKKRSSDPNNQIFFIVHGSDDNILFYEKKYWKDRPISLWISRHYNLNRWAIVGYRDIHDDFDVYNVFHVFEYIEKILCKVIDSKASVVNKSENNKLGSALSRGAPYRAEAGMVDDIITLYYMIREYRDNYMVRFEEDYNTIRPYTKDIDGLPTLIIRDDECAGLINCKEEDESKSQAHTDTEPELDRLSYMQAVSPFVFLLRYELSKKMSGLELSDLALNGYDFSYGLMNGTILKNSMLMDTLFYNTSMNGIDLGRCDLTGSTFSRCSAVASYFGDAVLSNILIEETPLEESIFDRAAITGSVFPNLNMKGCAFSGAAIVNSAFDNVRLTNSSFFDSKVISSRLKNCLMNDSKLVSISVSESMIDNCDLSGSNAGNSSISASSIVDSRLIRTNLSQSNLTSNLILNCDFSISQCQFINFTGSQILAATFNSASLNKSNFTHVYIGPYKLNLKSSWPVRDSEIYDEYNNVQQKLKTIELEHTGDGNVKLKDLTKRTMNLQTEVIARISSFSNALAEKCIFSDSELFQCRMHGALLNGSSFTNTKLLNSCFQNASLTNTMFTDVLIHGCSFTNASFDGALIANTKVKNTIMHNASFAKCNFTQCTIADSDMDNTSFDGSTIINCSFINVENIGKTIFNSTISNLNLQECTVVNVKITGRFENIASLKAEYDKLCSEAIL